MHTLLGDLPICSKTIEITFIEIQFFPNTSPARQTELRSLNVWVIPVESGIGEWREERVGQNDEILWHCNTIPTFFLCADEMLLYKTVMSNRGD